jgi:hypothetical protein
MIVLQLTAKVMAYIRGMITRSVEKWDCEIMTDYRRDKAL